MLRDPIRRRPAAALVATVLVAVSLAACSHTGLSGTVPTTVDKSTDSSASPSGPATTDTTLPGPSGSSGGGSGSSTIPDGFVIYQNLDTPSSLWRINADGTEKVQLPMIGGQLLSDPQLSPDASTLAFLATPIVAPPAPGSPNTPPAAAPKARLWISDPQGQNPRAVSADGVAQSCFAWSPDNKRLLSVGVDPATNAVISWLYPSDANQAAAPSHLALTGPACPVFLGNNTVVFTAPATGEDKPRPDSIVSRQLDGTPGPVKAALPGCDITNVRPAPDNRVIAFTARCDDPTKSGLYLTGDNSTPQLAIPDAQGSFAWSPDAQWFAYHRSTVADPRNTSEILVAHLNGAAAKRLVGPVSQSPTWGSTPSGGSSTSKA